MYYALHTYIFVITNIVTFIDLKKKLFYQMNSMSFKSVMFSEFLNSRSVQSIWHGICYNTWSFKKCWFGIFLFLFRIIQLVWSKSMRIEKTTLYLYVSSFVYGLWSSSLLSSCKKFPSGFFVRFWSGQFVKPIQDVRMVVLSFF